MMNGRSWRIRKLNSIFTCIRSESCISMEKFIESFRLIKQAKEINSRYLPLCLIWGYNTQTWYVLPKEHIKGLIDGCYNV